MSRVNGYRAFGLGSMLACTLWSGADGMAAETSYQIKPADDARMELTVEKTGLYRGKKHFFTFDRYSGILILEADAPERSRVELTIESDSIICHDTWVSMKDLRNIMEEATRNMLAVDRYPVIAFRSNRVTVLSAGKYEVQGALTIRGIAKPATVIIDWSPTAQPVLTFQGQAILRLTDYGLKPPSAVFGAIGTKNEMQFRFRLIAKPSESGSFER